MKRRTIATILLVLSFSNSQAWAEETGWIEVATNSGGIEYINPSRIRKTPQGLVVWTKLVRFNKGDHGQTWDMIQELYDCENETRRILNATLYDDNGAVLKSFHWEPGENTPDAVVPGTSGERTFRFVCRAGGYVPSSS